MKRNLFAELAEGLNEFGAAHEGKATLCIERVVLCDRQGVTTDELQIIHEPINASHTFTVRRLRVNEQT